MKLGTRIFFCYLLIFSICFYYPLDWMLDTLRTRYLESVEDPLVDQANILAALMANRMSRGAFDPNDLYKAFDTVRTHPPSAQIYEFLKTSVDMQFYITDAAGIVIFHSEDKAEIGKDYAHWRDVRLTLDGGYGARTTQKYEEIPDSSVLYVAAPIRVNGETAGVLTVVKPTTTIMNFLSGAKPRITMKGTIALALAALLSWLASIYITRPIQRLTQYANHIRESRRAPFPKLDRSEIGDMGEALKKMQEALEGKQYIEQYTQTLTHELKSPLSAIRGAAELLEENMAPDQQARFISNIRNESNRMQTIVDRMLELATLENLKMLRKTETVSLDRVFKTVVESKRPLWMPKGMQIDIRMDTDAIVKGDAFLLQQAIGNLVQNAIDFSPDHERIILSAETYGNDVKCRIVDNGPGMPDYAREKVFQKFFSLERPDTGKKSTGLGLNFVREVAHLHKGSVWLENIPKGGVCAVLVLPRGEVA